MDSGTAALDERPDGRRAPRQPRRSAPERYAWRDLRSAAGVLTLLRLPLAAAFAAVASRPLWAMLVLLAAGVSDVLDGWCARRFHQQTRTGAVADAVMDKVFVLTVVVSLLVHGSLGWVEVLLLGTRDLAEIAIALRIAATRHVPLPKHTANIAGKVATATQFAAVAAAILGAPGRSYWVALAAATGVVAGWSYWARERQS